MPTPVVVDLQGTLQPWQYLIDTYGQLTYLEAQTYPKFQLTRIEEMAGPALLQVLVLDDQARPATTQPVCLSWPSLESPSTDLPILPSGATKSLWCSRGVWQRVDLNGYTGFGLGKDSWIKDMAVGGPYSAFVLSPSAFSDGLAHFGWLGGTDHRGPCRLTFQLMNSANGTTPGATGDLAAVLAAINALDAKVTALARHLGLDLPAGPSPTTLKPPPEPGPGPRPPL